MSVNIRSVLIAVKDSGFYVIPDRLGITKEKISEYIKEHPMPEDDAYSLSDLISDLTEASPYKLYILPSFIKEATKLYIIKLIDDLRDDITHDIWKT